jgi:purine-binding chemotaxis protein CheW
LPCWLSFFNLIFNFFKKTVYFLFSKYYYINFDGKGGNRGVGEYVYYLEFGLGGKRFALPLEAVERVEHAVEVTLPPKAPPIVRGFIDYRGNILPVIDISRRFHLPIKDIEPRHHFIIVACKRRTFALKADTVPGLIKETGDRVVEPGEIIAGLDFLAGVIKDETGMILIPDLDKLLTHEEADALSEAMGKPRERKKNG